MDKLSVNINLTMKTYSVTVLLKAVSCLMVHRMHHLLRQKQKAVKV